MSLLPPYRAGARRPRRSTAYRPSVDGGGGAAAARRWGRPGSHRPGHALAGHDRPPPQGDEEIPRCPTAPPLAAATARACPSPPPRPPSLSSQAAAADPAAFAAAAAAASAWGVELLLGAWSMAEETARFPFTPPITLAINLPFLIAPGLSPSNLNQGRPVGRFLRCPLRAVGRRRRRGQSARAARVQRMPSTPPPSLFSGAGFALGQAASLREAPHALAPRRGCGGGGGGGGGSWEDRSTQVRSGQVRSVGKIDIWGSTSAPVAAADNPPPPPYHPLGRR